MIDGDWIFFSQKISARVFRKLRESLPDSIERRVDDSIRNYEGDEDGVDGDCGDWCAAHGGRGNVLDRRRGEQLR